MTTDLTPHVSYFKGLLSNKRFITREIIFQTIENDKFFGDRLAKTEILKLTRRLESSLLISQGEAQIITSERQPWLTRRKPDIDFFYWNRLRNYLNEQDILPREVVSRLDTDTDEILDCCGNPAEAGSWKYRGMVIGHVQSGKTTNYSALITKAADSGYKVIILLAGITNSLRSQTQQRIDEYFIGRKSIRNAVSESPLKIRNYGGRRNKDPDFGTTRDQDFNRQTAVIGAPFASLREPKIFIVKKNKSVLENLNIWIRDQAHGQIVEYPLLLIDDEADNASINTSSDPSRSTAINTLIRELMAKFSRSSYVGYTATPFANIFIEPDTSKEMEHEDLFPRNFIMALESPTNYCGAHRIFSDAGELRERMVVLIDDYVDILPLKHKKNDPLDCLPPSLEDAVRCFILARAIRFLRGDGQRHCTMMINVSRFNDMQEQVEGLVYDYLERAKASIAVSAKSSNPLRDNQINALMETFNREYGDTEIDFTDILKTLHNSSSTITVTTVNMRGGKLDYERQQKDGLHVIAIGGLALSRGLTLEGLVTTYLLRNVGASDTLMQMARWFGYRAGYEDLCRIFLPEEAAEHYRQISIAVEELRAEVNFMQESGQTPYDFGLKVRQSPTGIRITAANKMRSASELRLAADYSGRYVQGHAIFNNQNLNLKHRSFVASFLKQCGKPDRRLKKIPYWESISGGSVAQLLQNCRFPEIVTALTHINGNQSFLSDYLNDRVSNELSDWDVTIAARQSSATGIVPVTNLLEGYKLFPSERSVAEVDKGNYRFTGTTNSAGEPDSVKLGLTKDQIKEAKSFEKLPRDSASRWCRVREKPLLIIYLIGIDGKNHECQLEDYCVSLGFCLPITAQPVREQTYQVNEVFRRTAQSYEHEVEDDEDYLFGE